MSKKKIHLVCNAHLDPVWLWPWEDGLVIRLQELNGKASKASIRMKGARNAVTTEVPRYGLRTLIITRRGGKATAREVNLVEGL
jgi:hypothetical protein